MTTEFHTLLLNGLCRCIYTKLGWTGLMTYLTKIHISSRPYWTKLDGVFAEMQIIGYIFIILKHIQVSSQFRKLLMLKVRLSFLGDNLYNGQDIHRRLGCHIIHIGLDLHIPIYNYMSMDCPWLVHFGEHCCLDFFSVSNKGSESWGEERGAWFWKNKNRSVKCLKRMKEGEKLLLMMYKIRIRNCFLFFPLSSVVCDF